MSSAFDGSVKLPDGRRLSYRELGAPRGKPLLLFHAFPGSRYQCPDDDVARELDVRLIVPERPGIGLSDPPTGAYPLAAWARDVAALADALGVSRFAVAGFSIGGAFAVACAHELPERVTRLGLMGSIAPLDGAASWEGWGGVRALFELAQTDADGLYHAVASLAQSPEALVAGLAAAACAVDRQLLDEPALREKFLRDARETLRRGIDAVVRELVVVARPWGLEPRNVRVPAFVWHGLDDSSVPPAMARYLSATIPGCRVRFYEGEGHLVPFAHWREILSVLAD